ncbi:MAG TPA: right-handed parallel beta-helix repeat-containing protein, partial [Ktedonobacterales bacterium]|nr:right-handed parallel beta-helix repeat-containing protein [Ktedonobacterales bacterium]
MNGSVATRGPRTLVRNRWAQGALALALIAALAVGGAFVVRGTHASPPTVCPLGCSFTSISAAVAAAATNAIVTVGAGTYGPSTGDSQIILTQGITLQGIGGPVLDETTVNETQGAICTDCGGSPTPPAAGNITIEGFTINHGGGSSATPAFHQQILLKGLSASNAVTITNNTFKNTPDVNSGTDGLTAIYVYKSTGAVTTISNNTFNGVWQGALLELSTGASTITGNTFTGLAPSAPNPGHNDNGQAIHVSVYNTLTEAPTSITNNTFTNYGGNAITTNSGHSSQGKGTLQGVTITGNTFNMLTPVNPDSVLDLGSPTAPADGPTSSLTVSNNTFTLQGPVAGVNLHGDIVSGTISNNVIRGATPQPVIGLLIGGLDAATTVHITGNLLTGFNGGIITDSLANTTGVSASQNCIYANTTAASTGTGGNPFIATNNWWGATNGPGPSGSGNPVSGNVTVTPFLATAAAICSPVTTLAVGQPSAISGGATDVSTTTPITLSSLVAPATASTIAHIFYRFFLQATTPPGFTSVAGHTASFMLSGANGTYTVQDYAVDAAGNVEATHSTTLVL